MSCRLGMFLFIGAMFLITADAQVTGPETAAQPTLVSAPDPMYPREAKQAGIGGRISVRVVVDATGAIVSVGEPTGPAHICGGSLNDPRLIAMRNSVVEAIKRSKFDPAIKAGQPVKSVTTVSSTFEPFDGNPGGFNKKLVNVGVINAKALEMPKPEYPRSARASKAGGAVLVRVVVNEAGNVFTAEATSGHPLLRTSGVTAACGAKFSPTIVDGKPIRVLGIVTYNFVP